MVKGIGIMGGTFDPIHYGHLVTAEAARVEFGLEEVVFVPTGDPPHKDYQVTPAEHRYFMTLLATLTNPCFSVSRVDIERGGKTYTVDTIRDLQTLYDEGTQFYFITGADAILEILTWKDPDQLLRSCTFIAASRPGHSLERIQDVLGELYTNHKDRIKLMQVPALAISSTDVRARVATKRPIRYLVPEMVADYIEKSGLYR
ncbi:MAG: nicotinate-nucleotide adenylyltransferase [Limnochordia bacterium]|jgi:nicotinate-nucleotide adenylyltransferase